MSLLLIMDLIVGRQLLARLAATPVTLTPQQAADDLRASYAPLARTIADRIGLLEKTAAALDADAAAAAQLRADSIAWSNDVNARVFAGATIGAAADDAFSLCADSARKARWTLAGTRALFGL